MTHDSDFAPYDEEETAAQLGGIAGYLEPGGRVADLGAGRGRIARPLALGGTMVVAVDSSIPGDGGRRWCADPGIQLIEEDFLGPDPAWLGAGPFDVVCCLGNTINLFLEDDPLERLFELASRAVGEGGVLLLDDVACWCDELLDPGEWPNGIHRSGTQQLAWVPDAPIFSYRRGTEVDPGSRVPGPEERLLRLWSAPELDRLAGLHGWTPSRHLEDDLLMVFSRGS